MKFTRNVKIYRGQMDAAPWAGVFFLLVIFLLLNSSLVFTPGIHVDLPDVGPPDLPGTETPTLTVVIDLRGELYFNQRVIQAPVLEKRLREAARKISGLALVIQIDKAASVERFAQLSKMARDAGIHNVILAIRPALTPGRSAMLPPP
jgi:biopolymer transport protein ExbD